MYPLPQRCPRSLVSKFCISLCQRNLWEFTSAKDLFFLLLFSSLFLPVLCRNLKHSNLQQAWLYRTSLLSCPPHVGLMLTAIPHGSTLVSPYPMPSVFLISYTVSYSWYFKEEQTKSQTDALLHHSPV